MREETDNKEESEVRSGFFSRWIQALNNSQVKYSSWREEGEQNKTQHKLYRTQVQA